MEIKGLQKKIPKQLTGNKEDRTIEIQVPVDGSLELLALGDIGLIAWRAAKNQFIQSFTASTQTQTK